MRKYVPPKINIRPMTPEIMRDILAQLVADHWGHSFSYVGLINVTQTDKEHWAFDVRFDDTQGRKVNGYLIKICRA